MAFKLKSKPYGVKEGNKVVISVRNFITKTMILLAARTPSVAKGLILWLDVKTLTS